MIFKKMHSHCIQTHKLNYVQFAVQFTYMEIHMFSNTHILSRKVGNKNKTKYRDSNDIEFPPLKLIMNMVFRNIVKTYAKFDEPKYNGLSCIIPQV